VKEILAGKGKVDGIRVEDENILEADIVASSVDCNLTFNKLLRKVELPSLYKKKIDSIDYSSASAKINLILDELPVFRGREGEIGIYNGTIHTTQSIDEIHNAYVDAAGGEFSRAPVLELTFPSAVDKTLAPEGKHVMNIFAQYAPYHLNGGWTSVAKEKFYSACINKISEFSPNISNVIIDKQVLTPVDLEREFGLTGGNIFQGALTFDNLYLRRPGYRTPINGLYLCGSATHPGGGVTGMPGKIASGVILKDMERLVA
jgi:phytoene dehydrogenase-like protein